MKKEYDDNSAESIIKYAKKLKDKTLREYCEKTTSTNKIKGKGQFGQLLEKYYFGYEPNSNPEPDFPKANLELKASGLKKLQKGEFRAKERLVLNIINYNNIVEETFEESSFIKKNFHLLFVFYLYEQDKDALDFLIKLVDDWKFPNSDIQIIRQDWEKITKKIRDGKAHELSESDTLYLKACTKGSSAEKSLRSQPYSSIKAKQRALSLTPSYVNHIIANIGKNEKGEYGKILKDSDELLSKKTFEDFVIDKFKVFYGKEPHEIEEFFNLSLNKKSKSYYAQLTNKILGLGLQQKIEEFDKAEVIVKTVRLKENEIPKEHISFPTFKYTEIINTDWNNSVLKKILESKFFFVFYQYKGKQLVLREVKFWNMKLSDIQEAKKTWNKTVQIIKLGEIVQSINKNGIRKTNFPHQKENRIIHVRPHAQRANDTYPLPFKDRLTSQMEYTKHCFWLNASYIKNEILK